MKEQLISFETAKLAKEKGFNIPDMCWYESNNRHTKGILNSYNLIEERHWADIEVKSNHYGQRIYTAPTQALLQKWLRENHEIYIQVTPYFIPTKLHRFYITCEKDCVEGNWEEGYEKALEKGLHRALELI